MGQLGRLPPIEVFFPQVEPQGVELWVSWAVIHPLGCYFPLIEP